MKPRIWFFLPLVVSGFVLCEEFFYQDLSFQREALSAMCDVNCPNKSDAHCRDEKCQRTVKVISEEARANGKLACRSGESIVINKNPGTFVVERLLANNPTKEVYVKSVEMWMDVLEINKSCRYRFHRVFSDSISKPEVTPEILGIDDSNRVHVPVKNISVKFVNSNDTVPGRISAEIKFEPTADYVSCFYQVSCRQENGSYENVKEVFGYGESRFRIRFDDLPLNSNFTVTVHRKLTNVHDTNTSYAFTTPPGPTILQGKGDFQAKIVARANLIGATVASITILAFAGCCFFRFRRQLKPFQTTTRHSKVDEYEISKDRLTMTRVLGRGAFSVVKLGILRDDQCQTTAVAVKMMRDDSIPGDLRNFNLEIELVKSVGKHPNIVSFLGCCTIGPHPLIVIEYCSRGDLQSFLRAALIKSTASVVEETEDLSMPKPNSAEPIKPLEKNFPDLPETTSGGVDNNMFVCDPLTGQDAIADQVEIITVMDMLNYGRQIATGMEFLSSQRVVHRDLAARNILVCDNGIVKISDFGMSRDVYLENVYRKRGIGRMPLKWMAIEALTHQVFSTCSDVWSFGVLLWEIVTMGGDPYPGIPTIDILSFLVSGNRMERPESCSIPLYDVMLSCWQTTPQNRPSFTVLRQELDELISANADNDYIDVNDVPVIVPVGAEN